MGRAELEARLASKMGDEAARRRLLFERGLVPTFDPKSLVNGPKPDDRK